MCRVAVRDLAASQDEPGRSRRWASEVLGRWELGVELDRVLLVLNELVTNAVVHSPGRATCRLTVDRGALEVLVSDGGNGPPRRALRGADTWDPADWERSGGRGLQIVAAVADGWGAGFADGRAGVWARWSLSPGWPYAAACACDERPGPSLASGGHVHALSGPWDDPGRDGR